MVNFYHDFCVSLVAYCRHCNITAVVNLPTKIDQYYWHCISHYGGRVPSCNAFLCVHAQMKRLKELRGMMMEAEPCVAVTVRKLVMVSLMEIFKDISPTYRIRPLTAAEKSAKVTGSKTQSHFRESVLNCGVC